MAPASTMTATRKNKRIVSSPTPSDSAEPEMDYEDEDAEGENEDELDAEGSDMDVDELEDAPPPAAAIKLKFKIGAPSAATASVSASTSSSSRSKPRTSGVGGTSRVKGKGVDQADDEDEESEEDELQDDDVDSDVSEFDEYRKRARVSPTKMTARQRSKQNKDAIGEELIELPNQVTSSRKQILTDAEKTQKKEESARRRKRQLDQKLEDEKVETINRLLRAQTGRARNKADVGTPDPDATNSAPREDESVPTRLRMVSSIKSGVFTMSVSAPVGIESALNVGVTRPPSRIKEDAICAVDGCGVKRKYRSTKSFDVGGCSMEHLRLVNESL